MKKIVLLILGVALSFAIYSPKYVSAEIPEKVKVVYTTAKIYSETNIESLTNVIICNVLYGDILSTKSSNEILGADELWYYSVTVDNVDGYEEGYILKSHVLSVEIKSPNIALEYNAKIKKSSKIYIFDNNTYTETEIFLNRGENIRIISGYDKSKEYTKIQYLDENDNIITGYVKTDSIEANIISRGVISAIIIIICTVTIILIIFGIKGKNKKKRKKTI